MLITILGLQPIPGDPKDNGVPAMLDDRTFCFVIQHGHHPIVFLDLQGLVANQELGLTGLRFACHVTQSSPRRVRDVTS